MSKAYLKLFEEQQALSIFYFHCVFRDDNERSLNLVAPETGGITLDRFRMFIEFYLNRNYTFISQEDLAQGLPKDKKYAMITFDDGYYNNHLLLPLLKEYSIPAILFISSGHVIEQKSFWWDVLHRHRPESIYQEKQRFAEILHLKTLKHQEIENIIIDEIGNNAFKPVSDIDRPFTPSELKDICQTPWITIGNHTRNHALLTNYSHREITHEIEGCQLDLYEITGQRPKIISYPNGNYNDLISQISQKMGLQYGITVDARKNKLPLDHNKPHAMTLGRFGLEIDKNISSQCELFCSDMISYKKLRDLLDKRKRVSQ